MTDCAENTRQPAASFDRYARWYDQFNATKDYAAEIRYLLQKMDGLSAAPRTWLDVGCGTGQHLACLQQAGLQVEGVDSSPLMIEQARNRFPNIRFHCARADQFALPGARDVVSMLFHVMSYLTDTALLPAVLDNIRRHLAPGGLFAFDFWHAEAARNSPPGRRARSATIDGKTIVRVAQPEATGDDDLYTIRLTFHQDHEDGEMLHSENHLMRAYSRYQLEALLEESGFGIVCCEGWMQNQPLRAEDWYGIIIARN